MNLTVKANKALFSVFLISASLYACSRNVSFNQDNAANVQPASDVLDQVQVDETVLASVNGSRIGELDLTLNLLRTLGDSYNQMSDTGVEEQVLQSMIASRAIAIKSLESMSQDEKISLEKRVAQFREELLVKQYLLENAEPEAVTAEQIEAYYNDNPDQFSGKKEWLYELVTVDSAIYKKQTNAALQSLNRAKTHDDWRALASNTEQQAISVSHSYQTFTGDVPQGAIQEAVVKLNESQMSRIIISDAAPYLVRLLEVSKQPPVPLTQARASIRKKLLPASIKTSVRAISESAVAQSNVVLSQASE